MSLSAVFMCMGGVGHMQVLTPVMQSLAARGWRIRVMTKVEFRGTVEAVGAEFVDLFAGRPLEGADATSIPLPSRFVSFAAVYASTLARQVSTWAPDLIFYDTFTVVAPVVARLLNIPYVNICPNHALVPARVLAALRQDPRVAISAECHAAVERLKNEHGLLEASPFFYVQALSPHLNLYCEPPEFLAAEDHAAFEPVEFFGTLPVSAADADTAARALPPHGQLKVYVSFGTGVFRYFESAAVAALSAISTTFAGSDAELLISVGGYGLEPSVREALTGRNVRVADYVDQWRTLDEIDVFITHHGINSTHESIFHRTPMISYPFFGDQPDLARRCQEIGVAVPLTDSPRGPIEPEALRHAMGRLVDEWDAFSDRLAEARSWELRTIAGRDVVLDRIVALAGRRS